MCCPVNGGSVAIGAAEDQQRTEDARRAAAEACAPSVPCTSHYVANLSLIDFALLVHKLLELC